VGTISIEYNEFNPLIQSPSWIWMNFGLREGPWRLDLNQDKSWIFKGGRHALITLDVLDVLLERESIW